MSIWYDGSNLNMFRGDRGLITFQGLPCDKTYVAYFGVKSVSTNEIMFEVSDDVETYWGDEDGIEIERNEGETEEEYQARCLALSQLNPPEAYKYGKCVIEITPQLSKKLTMLKSEETKKYYFGLKVCCVADGDEDTLIPAVEYDSSGVPVFKDAPYLIVRQQYVEGLLPWTQYCDEDPEEIEKNPEDYGLQAYFGTVTITDLQDGDTLVYDATDKCWKNQHKTTA